MRIDEFMTTLQSKLDTLQPNYPDNAESILEVLFDAYNESSGFDNTAIKADFEELYRLMNGRPLKEIDEIFYAVCSLCRDHEKAGFIEGVRVGMHLFRDLNCNNSMLYHALVQLGRHELPFIIDTPFARIDTEHRHNISKHFFSKLKGQVFILSTNEEINSDHVQILRENIAATYMLENSDNKRTVVVQDIYFEV